MSSVCEFETQMQGQTKKQNKTTTCSPLQHTWETTPPNHQLKFLSMYVHHFKINATPFMRIWFHSCTKVGENKAIGFWPSLILCKDSCCIFELELSQEKHCSFQSGGPSINFAWLKRLQRNRWPISKPKSTWIHLSFPCIFAGN